ncbi:MAG TPA: LuxR C-terminal-related transcriptional regulator [Actinomycetota bacterium]|nr:LuxR C-terminal-related transcriptional regulator [Actinomycetota bacterium]
MDGEAALDKEELRALSLVADGYAAQRVARVLGVSDATLRRRLKRAAEKLGANSRINAVYLAARRGLI